METQKNQNRRRQENKKSGLKIMTAIFVLAAIGIFGILFLTFHISSLEVWYMDMLNVEYKDLSYMENIEQLMYKHETLVFEHMVTTNSKTKHMYRQDAEKVQEEINTLLLAFGETIRGRENEAYYHKIFSAFGSYFDRIELIFDFSEEGAIATAESFMNMTMANNIAVVNSSVDELKQLIKEDTDAQNTGMLQRVQMVQRMVSGIMVVIVLMTVSTLWLTGKLANRIINIDPLTDIPNAECMEGYLLKLKKKKKIDQYSAILVNIKDFNYLNRQYGTDMGDRLLRAYGKKLKQMCKDAEWISRQSGDFFFALIRNENVDDYLKKLKNLQIEVKTEDTRRQFVLHARRAVYPIKAEDSIGDIINNVSMTLSTAKRLGLKDPVWFSEDRYQQMLEEKEVLAKFTKGLENEEFVVYYQPKVDAKNKKLGGCEALVRWIHEGQMVPPGKFIPVLESEGKVVDLDFYVFEHVCRDIADWLSRGIEPVRISSNFSKLHLQNKNLAEDILHIMDKYKIDPKYVELELTESSGYDDLVMLKKFVKKMNEEQIHTSMDDFGTGYSSLSMLKDVNVDVVKLDKSFLNGVEQGDESKEKMISHLIHMIQDLNRTVVCEGVETEKEFEFLKAQDCDLIQGYLFDKPLPHDDFEKRLVQPEYEKGA